MTVAHTTGRKAFFDAVRSDPFDGVLTSGQVDGMARILDEWDRRALTDKRWLAYMLATVFWECARTMQPIEEIGKGHGHAYGVPDPVTHKTYYGRGLVQLTWKDNYAKMGVLTCSDLLLQPELALKPDIAVMILFVGMSRGTFTGKKLSDYFNATRDDPLNARRIINGLDRAHEIETVYRAFLIAIEDMEA